MPDKKAARKALGVETRFGWLLAGSAALKSTGRGRLGWRSNCYVQGGMDHEVGMLLWWTIAVPAVLVIVWLFVTYLRPRRS